MNKYDYVIINARVEKNRGNKGTKGGFKNWTNRCEISSVISLHSSAETLKTL